MQIDFFFCYLKKIQIKDKHLPMRNWNNAGRVCRAILSLCQRISIFYDLIAVSIHIHQRRSFAARQFKHLRPFDCSL